MKSALSNLWQSFTKTQNNLIWYQKCLIWVFFGKNLKTLFSYLKSSSWIFLVAEFSEKTKMPRFGPKNPWFAYFPVVIWKYYCRNWNLCPRICLAAKFGAKMKIHKFGTKNVFFGYFFFSGIWKHSCNIWNQHPPISLMTKFQRKEKFLNLGWKMIYLHIFISKNLKIIFSYLKTPSWIFVIPEFSEKTKMPDFGRKNAWFAYFSVVTWKYYIYIIYIHICHNWNLCRRVRLAAKN